MKFLVPNCSWLQNPWLGGYRPQIPVLSVLCPQLNLLNPLPPRTKFLGTPLPFTGLNITATTHNFRPYAISQKICSDIRSHTNCDIVRNTTDLYHSVSNSSSRTKANRSGNAELTKWVSGTHSSYTTEHHTTNYDTFNKSVWTTSLLREFVPQSDQLCTVITANPTNASLFITHKGLIQGRPFWFPMLHTFSCKLCNIQTAVRINPLAPELFFFFFNFSTPVYKMWINQEPNKLALWNKLHFEEKKNGKYRACLKYSIPIFVE